jgi:hypothetical protein
MIPVESICQLNGEAFSKVVLINCTLVSWQKAGEEVHRVIANTRFGKIVSLFKVFQLILAAGF